MGNRAFDVTALGELLIDFTENGSSAQGNPMLEANPGGAPCNVLAMLEKRRTAYNKYFVQESLHHGNHLVLSFCKFGKILLSFHLPHLLVEFALFDLQNLLQLLTV